MERTHIKVGLISIVTMVLLQSAKAAEIVVYDTIGASNEHVSGNIGAWAWAQTGSGAFSDDFFGVPGTVVTVPVGGLAGHFTGTYYGICYDDSCGTGTEEDPFDFPWQDTVYKVHVWAGGTDYFFTNFGGDGGNLGCTQGFDCIYYYGQTAFVSEPVGVYFHSPTGDYLRQRNVTFDLTSLNITVAPGQEIVVSVSAMSGGDDVFHSVSTWDGHPDPDASDVYVSVRCQPGGCLSSGCGVCANYIGPTGLDWGYKWFGSRLTIITEDAPVPAVSSSGLATLSLLVLASGALIGARRGGRRRVPFETEQTP